MNVYTLVFSSPGTKIQVRTFDTPGAAINEADYLESSCLNDDIYPLVRDNSITYENDNVLYFSALTDNVSPKLTQIIVFTTEVEK